MSRNRFDFDGVSKAQETLLAACEAMDDRAASRDLPEGERSMSRAVLAFNALTGQTLTETQGWLFMAILKAARATAGEFRADDYVDMAAYSGLACESADRERHVARVKEFLVPDSAAAK